MSEPALTVMTPTRFPRGSSRCTSGTMRRLEVNTGTATELAISRWYFTRNPQFVVIDEVAGQLVALIAVPLAWKTFLAGFILFRAFDILKPPPVRQLEKLPEGTGIVLDDVADGRLAAGFHTYASK